MSRARAPQRGLADRQRRRRVSRQHLLDARIAIERDVLVVQHRIRIGDGGGHQRARVFRRRGHDDLQARRAIEPRLGVLAVIRAGVAQAAPRHAHHHRHFPAPAIPDLRGVVDELIESGRDEIVELHFADRPQSRQRGADAHAEHGAFGERRVANAIAVVLEQRLAAAGTRCRTGRRRLRRRRRRADRLSTHRRRRASPLRGRCCPSCRTASPVRAAADLSTTAAPGGAPVPALRRARAALHP